MKILLSIAVVALVFFVACSDETKDNAVALGKSLTADAVDVGSAALDKGKELTHDAAEAVSEATK